MSEHKEINPLQLQDIEKQQPMEDVPLNDDTNIKKTEGRRVKYPGEQQRRARLLAVFQHYDHNNDGSLNVKELKRLVKECIHKDLPRGAAKEIMKLNDTDYDGLLSFTEFYQMCIKNDWLIKDYAVRYCKLIVPQGATYEDNMKFCPPPLTMVIFSIIEIIFFVVDIISLDEHKKEMSTEDVGRTTNGPAATLFLYTPYRRYEAWRFVTYMFVHIGVMHLIMNLIVQLMLGVALELVHHWWRIALVYLAGVAAGSMGTSIHNPNICLAGASGGVYALIIAHIATIIMNWKEMEFAIIQLFVFVVFCGTDISVAIYHQLHYPDDKVGYMAHLCGGIAGLLVGIGVLRNLKELKWERKLWWCAMTLYFALMLAGIAIHLFYPEHFKAEK